MITIRDSSYHIYDSSVITYVYITGSWNPLWHFSLHLTHLLCWWCDDEVFYYFFLVPLGCSLLACCIHVWLHLALTSHILHHATIDHSSIVPYWLVTHCWSMVPTAFRSEYLLLPSWWLLPVCDPLCHFASFSFSSPLKSSPPSTH